MSTSNPGSYPLPTASISGNLVTVDDLTRPVTVITERIFELLDANMGYFIEKVLGRFPNPVIGGGVRYREMFPEDWFLDPTRSGRGRAPGAEAPLVGGLRRASKMAYPASWAAKLEVTDEARSVNDVMSVEQDITALGNSLGAWVQDSGIAAIEAFITSASRAVTSTVNWRQAYASGVINADPATLPIADFALAKLQRQNDKVGYHMREDLQLLSNGEDLMYLDLIYGDKLETLLKRQGIGEILSSPEVTEGSPIIVAPGGAGYIAYQKELATEEGRGPVGTFKDVFATETQPVFALTNAAAIQSIAGVNA